MFWGLHKNTFPFDRRHSCSGLVVPLKFPCCHSQSLGVCRTPELQGDTRAVSRPRGNRG